MQSEGSSYKVTIFKNSEKPTGLHQLLSRIRNERVNGANISKYFDEIKFTVLYYKPVAGAGTKLLLSIHSKQLKMAIL